MSQPSPDPSLDALTMTKWDVIVIGAGPAGALAAHQLAMNGRRVLLVERKTFPRWKICGACLNGHALGALRSVGLGSLVTRSGGIELEEFQLGFRGRTARVAISEGMALSRANLDAGLVEAATTVGATFVEGTQAAVGDHRSASRSVRLTQGVHSVEVEARVIVVAAGLAGLHAADGFKVETKMRAGSRIGAGCVLDSAPGFYRGRTIFMAVGKEGYVGTVRVENGGINIAAAFEPALVRRLGSPGTAAAAIVAEAGFPAIEGLETALWQGTPGLTRQTRPLAGDRIFLIGDAAGYVEPFTGEGIAWALISAQAVVPLVLSAIDGWDQGLGQAWSRLHRRLIGRRQFVCRAVAAGLRRPWLASVGFEVLSRVPAAAGFGLRHRTAPPSFTHTS